MITNFIFIRSLKKLSEESLTRPPEEVFDLLEKLGEGLVEFYIIVRIVDPDGYISFDGKFNFLNVLIFIFFSVSHSSYI